MKLVFLKIDKVFETDKNKVIEIPAGGIQFEHRGQTIQSVDPVQIEMTHYGKFYNIVRYIYFAVYADLSLNTTGEIMRESLFSVVAHEEVYTRIYKQMKKHCKVVPMYKPLNVSELFYSEFENAYMQMMEG